MPGGFPGLLALANFQEQGVNLGNVSGTQVTSSATANTKGAWTQLTASVPYDCVGLGISVNQGIGGASDYNRLFDIGIGANPNEDVIIENIYWNTNEPCCGYWFIPIHLDAGQRITARTQENGVAGNSLYFLLHFFDGGFEGAEGCAGMDSLGAVTSTSLGTTLDSGATANTKPSSFTELIASTARDYVGLMPMFGSNGTVSSTYIWNGLCDIAIGSAGNERIIIPDIAVVRSSGGQLHGPHGGCTQICPVNIPAGTRVSARLQSSVTDASSRVIQLALGALYR